MFHLIDDIKRLGVDLHPGLQHNIIHAICTGLIQPVLLNYHTNDISCTTQELVQMMSIACKDIKRDKGSKELLAMGESSKSKPKKKAKAST